MKRGRKCLVCSHRSREDIDQALVEGEADTALSAKFRELSDDAIRRHRQNHLPAAMRGAREAADVAHADSLLRQVRDLQRRALAILDTAEEAGDLRTALSAIREARGNLELLARLIGELKDPMVLNLTVNAEWVSLQGTIVTALAPYPQARAAVLAALEGHGVIAA